MPSRDAHLATQPGLRQDDDGPLSKFSRMAALSLLCFGPQGTRGHDWVCQGVLLEVLWARSGATQPCSTQEPTTLAHTRSLDDRPRVQAVHLVSGEDLHSEMPRASCLLCPQSREGQGGGDNSCPVSARPGGRTLLSPSSAITPPIRRLPPRPSHRRQRVNLGACWFLAVTVSALELTEYRSDTSQSAALGSFPDSTFSIGR